MAGDTALVHRAATGVLTDWRDAARRRLPELLGTVRARAERSGELAYLIEPDLKEARGGIRDAVVLSALAATWLTDRPHGTVDDAYTHLLDVRDAPPRIAARIRRAMETDSHRIRDGGSSPRRDRLRMRRLPPMLDCTVPALRSSQAGDSSG
jgi:UTP:GlnB (protein PII) uridylyltransferase